MKTASNVVLSEQIQWKWGIWDLIRPRKVWDGMSLYVKGDDVGQIYLWLQICLYVKTVQAGRMDGVVEGGA